MGVRRLETRNASISVGRHPRFRDLQQSTANAMKPSAADGAKAGRANVLRPKSSLQISAFNSESSERPRRRSTCAEAEGGGGAIDFAGSQNGRWEGWLVRRVG